MKYHPRPYRGKQTCFSSYNVYSAFNYPYASIKQFQFHIDGQILTNPKEQFPGVLFEYRLSSIDFFNFFKKSLDKSGNM